MKTLLGCITLGLLFFVSIGCVSSGSSFTELTITYPNEGVVADEGGLLVNLVIARCKEQGLVLREGLDRKPEIGDTYALLRTTGNDEPIIWVAIYRVSEGSITISVSALAKYDDSEGFLSLVSALNSEVQEHAGRRKRFFKMTKHGNSIFH